MEQGRLNFLTYQIVSGLKFITINNVRYKLISPSKELKLLAEYIYQDTMDSLRFDNLISKEQASFFLMRLGKWAPNDEVELKKLEKHLDDRKVELYKSVYNSDKQKRLKRAIKGVKNSIQKANTKKYSLEYMTLEYHALLTKTKFLVAMCLRDENNNSIYNEENFWNEDSNILEKTIDILESQLISIDEIRELARSDPWRSMWNLGKESCMGSSVSEWTEEQKTLVTFSKMYESAHQSMECPADEVFKDDDMFDGWMIDQQRIREKEQKQKQVDTMKSINESAQEVFVFAPTREDADKVYGMNDLDSRMKLRQRQKVIENRGKIEAKDLPDTQLDLRRQQSQEYKDKMRRS
tara:strand:- start:2891 stop:3943 length:1053 start_codon:yes stop_codon:yes gene_type:complete